MDCKCKLPFSDAHLSKLNYILNYKMMECPKFKIGNWLCYISILYLSKLRGQLYLELEQIVLKTWWRSSDKPLLKYVLVVFAKKFLVCFDFGQIFKWLPRINSCRMKYWNIHWKKKYFLHLFWLVVQNKTSNTTYCIAAVFNNEWEKNLFFPTLTRIFWIATHRLSI